MSKEVGAGGRFDVFLDFAFIYKAKSHIGMHSDFHEKFNFA